MTGRRHCAGRIVGIGAGADNRTVADPAQGLAGHSAGRGGGSEIAFAISGNGTHRSGLGRGSAALTEDRLQFPPALIAAEIGGLGKGHTLLAAKGKGALADHQYMLRVVHHRPSRQYRVARPEDAGHRTRPAIASVHHRGIHLLRTGGGEDAAPPRIEQRVVFERYDRLVTASSAVPPVARMSRPTLSARRSPS